jgi:hypothetical protein
MIRHHNAMTLRNIACIQQVIDECKHFEYSFRHVPVTTVALDMSGP